MAERKGSPAFNFVVEQLKESPELSFADIKLVAAQQGLKIYPILYGRAKALLGLVPVAPRGSKKAKAKAKKRSKPESGERPEETEDDSGTPLESLSAVIEAMKACEQQRETYRRALEEIAEIIRRAL